MNLALIGLGYWGPNLLRTFNNLGVLKAAYDLDPNKINKFRKEASYKEINFSTDYTEIFKDSSINAVVIATPPNTHYKIAMECLRAGKHLFIEKPMTLNSVEAEEIVSYAKCLNLVVMVGHIFLYSPEILKLKSIVNSADFGKIQYVYLKRLNLGKIQAPANVIEDLAPHDISILNFILGTKCTAAQAVAKAHILNTEDVAFINLKYNGILCNLHLSWLDPFKVRDTIVVGSKQMVLCDSVNKKIHLYDKGVDLDEMEKGMETYADHLLSYRYGDETIPYILPIEPMVVECNAFIDAVNTNTSPVADGALGAEVVKVIESIQQSIDRNGAWVLL